MCRYRRVNIYYTTCGHNVPQPDEVVSDHYRILKDVSAAEIVGTQIPCDDTKCIFSARHGAACTMATCKQTCWQRFQYPEMYSPNINSSCPRCSQGN